MNLFGKNNPGDADMPFFEHLEVLRWHIIRSLVAVGLFTGIGFVKKEFLFGTLIFGPTKPDFLTYRTLCWLSDRISLGKALCIDTFHFTFINTELAGQFVTHIKAAFIFGFIVAFPYILFEIWRFVRPALHINEAAYARGLVFFSSLLFFTGALFGYFILVPTMLNFLGNYQVTDTVQNTFTLTNYIGFISMFVLSAGLIFELPMVIYFLSKLGLVTPGLMRRFRKHAIIVILIVSAVITPSPDIGSQILVFIPVYFLYEISIFISARVEKNRSIV